MTAGLALDNGEPLAFWREPAETDLRLPPHRCLYDYWRKAPRDGRVARIGSIDPADIRGALGYVMILTVVDGGRDFRYSLYGSRIATVSGFDMTGRHLSDLPTTDPIRDFFLSNYRLAVEENIHLYAVNLAPQHITVGEWHRLILPVGTADGVDRLLVCNVPVYEDGRIR